MMTKLTLSVLFACCLLNFFPLQAFAQKKSTTLDLSPFESSAHHWYDIFDSENIIDALPGKPKYTPDQIEMIADNILRFQKNNGGWPKNYDMQAILDESQLQKLKAAVDQENTTFDNSTTYSQVAYLAKAYAILKKETYKEASLRGLDFMLKAQYPNGGWPQYYPIQKGYSRHITYNDDAMIGVMLVLKYIIDHHPEYAFVNKERMEKVKLAFSKGIDCILNTQIREKGELYVWCQQHDENSLLPAWARAFEPPSICNDESSHIVLLLMDIDHPKKEIKNAVQAAVKWFEASEIKGIRIKTIPAPEVRYKYHVSKTDRVVVDDATAPVIWTRYNELETHRPLFCNRDSKYVYSLDKVERERRTGYSWYTYEPQRVLNKYAEWSKKWGTESN